VLDGVTLAIEPGVTLQFAENRSIQIKGGRILAEGTISQPITFTHYGGDYWGGILLHNTHQDNRIRYAVIEYTREAISYPRTHGVTAYSSRVTIADSVIRHTEVSNGVIADWGSTLYLLDNEIYDVQGDAVHATRGYAYIQGNHIHDIRRGIYPLEGIELSNMSTPAIVLDNHIHDVSDDCMDLNTSSAIIERNELHHCGDKGISIGQYPSVTTLTNNLIYECQGKDDDPYSGTGIAVKDGAVSYMMNNTVSGCRHGIYLYQGHRGWGGGTATIVNTVLWDNWENLELDGLSTLNVTYSNVGQYGVLPWPGEGNVNADPLFRAPESGDYRLQAESACVDAGTATGAPAEDVRAVCRPHGAGHDMGAHEFQDDWVSGVLTEDTTLWASCHPTYVITDDVVVSPSVTLTIKPSVTLRFQAGRSLIVQGRLAAVGTPSLPIVFTRDGDDSWGAIILQNSAADNRIEYATIEHAAVAPLEAAIAAYSSTLRVGHCTIHQLEGTALLAENGDVQVRDSHIHSAVGDCMRLIRSSATIERNELHHCTQTGISAGAFSSITVVNNLVYANTNGIEVKDGARAVIVNDTVSDNAQNGIRLYEEYPGAGGGIATVLNSIVWGNGADLEVDARSTITVTYSNVYTYVAAGTLLWPGEGNVNADPLFRAPQSSYRLMENSPCIDAGTAEGAPDEDVWHIYRPRGEGYDMGAHEFFEYFDLYLPLILR